MWLNFVFLSLSETEDYKKVMKKNVGTFLSLLSKEKILYRTAQLETDPNLEICIQICLINYLQEQTTLSFNP